VQIENIKEFRMQQSRALEAQGFVIRKLGGKRPPLWFLPDRQVEPQFYPGAQGRWWGYLMDGVVAIEIPIFRRWVSQQDGGVPTLHPDFIIGSHVANDSRFRGLSSVRGKDTPIASWIQVLKKVLYEIPATLPELFATYKTSPEKLGPLGSSFHEREWQLLLDWWAARTP
jgi:hypothetical protein